MSPFIKISVFGLVIIFFSAINVRGEEHQYQSLVPMEPSAIYVRALLGRNYRYYGAGGSALTMPDKLLTLWQNNFTVILRDKMVTQSDRNCLRDIETILKFASSEKKPSWALQYIEASGKPPDGRINKGDQVWFGNFDECLAIKPVRTSSYNRTIKPQYCNVGLKIFNQQELIIGLCVPVSCNEDILTRIISELRPLNSSFHTASSCQLTDPPLTKNTYIAIEVCSVIGFFVLIGLVVDVTIRLRNFDLTRTDSYSFANDSTRLIGQKVFSDTSDIERSSPSSLSPHPARFIFTHFRKFLLSFSPYTNFAKLFTLPQKSTSTPNLPALSSIRALSLFWIIFGHCFAFLNDNSNNWSKHFAFQFVLASLFAVDSFFFLSGFFAYWSISLRFDKKFNEKSNEGKCFTPILFFKSLPFVYLHRFVRILPPYAALIMIEICLWPHFSNGPFYFQGTDMTCAKNWWKNLLFVNNFLSLENQCLPWSWYLAVDMQFFIFVPFLVWLFLRRPCLAWAGTFFAILGQTFYATSVTFLEKIPSSPYYTENQAISITKSYFETIYMKPYSRFGPYLVGIIVGHLVAKQSLYLNQRIFTRPALTAFLWLVCVSTFFALIFGQFGINSGRYVNPRFVDAFYNSYARTAWGLALGWLVISLVFNRAGPVGDILSWPAWTLPARLSYSAYLTHPLILIFFAQTARHPFDANSLLAIFYFFGGTLLVTFIVSILFSLVFESPIIRMQQLSTKLTTSF